MRTQKQTYWDYIATLLLFNSVNNVGTVDGNLKIQKLPFIIEFRGLEKGLKTLYLKFFRYTWGPYSKELSKDIEFLTKAEVITSSKKLTKKGHFLLDYFLPEINANPTGKETLNIIDEVVKEYGKKSGPRLKDIVYEMKVPVYDLGNELKKVRDIDFFLDIFVPTECPNLKDTMIFSPESLSVIEEELKLPLSALDPSSRDYQKTVKGASRRIQQALTA